MKKYIEILNARKYYPGIQALDGVDLDLSAGEIHCLVGENGSGKSTLIKILSGVVPPDSGTTIRIDGQEVRAMSTRAAIDRGIRVIYQDLALFPNLTVEENIAFRSMRQNKRRWVRREESRSVAKQALGDIGVHLDLAQLVGALSIAEQQLVEIARALTGTLRLLILDEPTASLTRKEVDALFTVIHRMQQSGTTILFVSHKLNEIFEIAERVTILRDGKKIGSYKPSELDQKKLTYLMTGHEIKRQLPRALEHKEALLEISNLSKRNNYRDISFTLHAGEIIGITGLLGSGRSELAQSIFGMNPADSGAMRMEGKRLLPRSSSQALKQGIGYVPENRISEGVIARQSIADNTTVTVWNRLCNRIGLISKDKLEQVAKKWVSELGIKISSLESAVNTLSGGNQQKVVLAKWLAADPKILILDEPTVGIDVFAKDSVHRFIKTLAERGIGIILISAEIPEVVNNCHRILIMRRGRIVYECPAEGASADELMEKSSGV